MTRKFVSADGQWAVEVIARDFGRGARDWFKIRHPGLADAAYVRTLEEVKGIVGPAYDTLRRVE